MTTEQKLRIFAAYIPCKCIYPGSYEEYNVLGLSLDEGNIQVQSQKDAETGFSDWWNIDDAKLILRHLSSITDEDAIEVAGILGKSEMDTRDWLYNHWSDNSQYYLVQYSIDHLRAKGYDCDHGPIPSLIAAGIAVEEK